MRLIICVDDKYGIQFNNRRQSRDAKVYIDILELIGSGRLIIGDYSRKLFNAFWNEQICIGSPEIAEDGDYYFAEKTVPEDFTQIDEVILYKWNRAYPASAYFPENVLGQYTLCGTKEFVGTSHEKITREVYRK